MRSILTTLLLSMALFPSDGSAQGLGRISSLGQSVSTRPIVDPTREEGVIPEDDEGTERQEPPVWNWLVVPAAVHGRQQEAWGITAVVASAHHEFDVGYAHVDPDGAANLDVLSGLYKFVAKNASHGTFGFAVEAAYEDVEDIVDTTSFTLAGSYGLTPRLTLLANVGWVKENPSAASATDDQAATLGMEFAATPNVLLAADHRFENDLGRESSSAAVTWRISRAGAWRGNLTFKAIERGTYVLYAVIPL
jgi:hypothetical protein